MPVDNQKGYPQIRANHPHPWNQPSSVRRVSELDGFSDQEIRDLIALIDDKARPLAAQDAHELAFCFREVEKRRLHIDEDRLLGWIGQVCDGRDQPGLDAIGAALSNDSPQVRRALRIAMKDGVPIKGRPSIRVQAASAHGLDLRQNTSPTVLCRRPEQLLQRDAVRIFSLAIAKQDIGRYRLNADGANKKTRPSHSGANHDDGSAWSRRAVTDLLSRLSSCFSPFRRDDGFGRVLHRRRELARRPERRGCDSRARRRFRMRR